MRKRLVITLTLLASVFNVLPSLAATEIDGKYILNHTIDIPFLYYAVCNEPVDYKSVFKHGVSFNNGMKQEYLRTKDAFKKKELLEKYTEVLEGEFKDLADEKLAFWTFIKVKPYDFETSSFKVKFETKGLKKRQGNYLARWKYPKRLYNISIKSIDEAKKIENQASKHNRSSMPALIIMKAKETNIKGNKKEIVLEPLSVEVYERGTNQKKQFKTEDKLVFKFDL